jgi:hypothetical protein
MISSLTYDVAALPHHPDPFHSTAKEMDSGKAREAWKQIVAKHGGELKESDIDYATFWFLDLMLAGSFGSYLWVFDRWKREDEDD